MEDVWGRVDKCETTVKGGRVNKTAVCGELKKNFSVLDLHVVYRKENRSRNELWGWLINNPVECAVNE